MGALIPAQHGQTMGAPIPARYTMGAPIHGRTNARAHKRKNPDMPGYWVTVKRSIVHANDLSEARHVALCFALCVQTDNHSAGLDVAHIGVIAINHIPAPECCGNV